MPDTTQMIKVFFSYSHQDEEWRDLLDVHLSGLKRSGLISAWHDRRILAGKDLDREIGEQLEAADLFLLLLSPFFLASDYCYETEARRALERHEAGTAVVIPIIVQPCDWLASPFRKLRATPRDGMPVAKFPNIHDGLLQVTQDIRAAAIQLDTSDESQLGVSRSILTPGSGSGSSNPSSDRSRAHRREPARSSEDVASIRVISVNQQNGLGQFFPANVLGALGQIDVIVNVDPRGQVIEAVLVTLQVGANRVTQSLADPVALAAIRGGQPSRLAFRFNTAAFNAATGVPMLVNGPMSIVATATSTNRKSASSTVKYHLANTDCVLVTTAVTPYTNAQGVAMPTRTTDEYGYDWHHGSVTVAALPILYSGRKIASLSIMLPGANIPTQHLTSAPYVATWPATSASDRVPHVSGRKLTDAAFFEVNGLTPKGVMPTVAAIDSSGESLDLIPVSVGTAIRLDNGVSR